MGVACPQMKLYLAQAHAPYKNEWDLDMMGYDNTFIIWLFNIEDLTGHNYIYIIILLIE